MRIRRQFLIILVGMSLSLVLLFEKEPGDQAFILAQEAGTIPQKVVLTENQRATPAAPLSISNSARAAQAATAAAAAANAENTVYFPLVRGAPPPALLVPVPVSAEPPIDFEAVRQDARANGWDLAFNKIGFHIQLFGSRDGLEDYIQALDSAGVPVVLKAANDAEFIYKTQLLAEASGVEHVLIYRDATHGRDIPDYGEDPVTAARLNWAENRRVFPPELDPALVWMETINEPNRLEAAWLAEFALEQAKTAVREGARYAAFGWAGGEPERAHWESPEMLEFLRFAAEHPDQIAVALHEYSFVEKDIGNGYPDLIGRFQTLFDVADKHGIPRPTVLITEWGWEYNQAPLPEQAMQDMAWAAWLYAAYPQVKGAAIWTLGIGGGEFGSIGEDVLKYIEPMTAYSLGNYFLYSPGTRPIDEHSLAPDSTPPTPPPNPTPTPEPTATPDPTNLLGNGSFEDGWETIDFGNQRPNSWQISWVQPGDPLYDSPDLATGICECVHKLKDQLPPEEQPGGSDPLILDGVVTYKIFSASQSFGTQLSQTVSGLTPGETLRLSVPLRLHHNGEIDPFGAEAGVWVDGKGDWSNVEDMGDRKWCKHELTFAVPASGSVTIDVRVKSKYPSAKDFFMDDFRLGLASEPPPHPQYPLCDPTPEIRQYLPFLQGKGLDGETA